MKIRTSYNPHIKFYSILIFICFAFLTKTQAQNAVNKDVTSYFYLKGTINKQRLNIDSERYIYQITELKNTNKKDISSFYYLQNNKLPDFKSLKIIAQNKSKYYIAIKNIQDLIKPPPKKIPDKKEGIREKIFPDWLIAIMIFSFILLAFVNFYDHTYIGQIFESLINFRVSIKLKNESSALSEKSAVLLMFMFFLNISMFIYQVFLYFNLHTNINSILLFFVIFLIVISYFLFKYVIIQLLGNIFDATEVKKLYIHNTNLLNQINGIILLISVIVIPFIDNNFIVIIIYATFILLIISYIIRVLRTVQIFSYKHFSLLYLFLYFCTVEILPFFIIIKVLRINIF